MKKIMTSMALVFALTISLIGLSACGTTKYAVNFNDDVKVYTTYSATEGLSKEIETGDKIKKNTKIYIEFQGVEDGFEFVSLNVGTLVADETDIYEYKVTKKTTITATIIDIEATADAWLETVTELIMTEGDPDGEPATEDVYFTYADLLAVEEIDEDNYDVIVAMLASYDALTPGVKAEIDVTDLTELVEAYELDLAVATWLATVTELLMEEGDPDAEPATEDVYYTYADLLAVEEITEDNYDAVVAMLASYDALEDAVQEEIGDVTDLTELVEAYELDLAVATWLDTASALVKTEAEGETPAVYYTYAEMLEFVEITQDNYDAVVAMLASYDALEDAVQEEIGDVTALKSLVEAYEEE